MGVKDVLPLTASTNPGSPLGLQISHGDSFHDEWIEDIAWQGELNRLERELISFHVNSPRSRIRS